MSGELYTGPEPDWSFTDDVQIVELQLGDPLSSRRIFIMEGDGKVLHTLRIHALDGWQNLEGLGVPG